MAHDGRIRFPSLYPSTRSVLFFIVMIKGHGKCEQIRKDVISDFISNF